MVFSGRVRYSLSIQGKEGILNLDQQKAGRFLKELRNGKHITQEELAKIFHVSSRTVSRWENGTNLPDISLLVKIADFYDVDVREIIEGERKSENMDKEVKDVAEKMADYAGAEKSRLLKSVRVISLIGTVLLTIAIAVQCITYEPDILRLIAMILSFLGLIALAITTLYANGILSKLVKKKGFSIAVLIIVIALVVTSVRYLFVSSFIIGFSVYDFVKPYETQQGIENFDKKALMDKYGGDLDSGLFVFPDDTSDALTVEYESSLKTGMLDTDGSIFLTATYTDEDLKKEMERLSQITCTVFDTNKDDSDYHTTEIRYDTDSYNYPAYVAADGFRHVYEYALIDEGNNKITYVLLMYPDTVRDKVLAAHKDVLKKAKGAYNTNGGTLDNFTIYSFSFTDGIWCEYDPQDEGRVTSGNPR